MSFVVIGALVIGAGVTGARALLDERSLLPANPSPGPAGKIAFNSDRNGDTEIYVMNADGSGQTNVSHGPGDITSGAWSPDGSRIAFHRDGNGQVYVVNSDGSGLTNVSNDPCGASLIAPGPLGGSWSPDGSRIAFNSGGGSTPPGAGDCGPTIYVVNADGSGLTNLTNGPASYSQNGGWSPDGSRFAFTSDRNGNGNDNRDVYVVNADGSGLTNLSNKFSDDYFSDNPGADGPTWSPDSSHVRFIDGTPHTQEGVLYEVNADGSGLINLGDPGPNQQQPREDYPWISGGPSPDGVRIAFFSNHDGNEELYVVNADGSGLTRLTNNPASDANLVWSPDSSRIAFHSDRGGNNEIYVVNADGSGLTNLSIGPGPGYNFLAVGGWSPDSSRIAFNAHFDGIGEIYVVNADGSGLTNLTNNPADDGWPVWSPAP